jgi:hypothetical protein
MTRGHRPGSRRARDNTADPLDEALRQIGAEMLDEPVPERLREVLRQARGQLANRPASAADQRGTRGSERG